MDLARALIPMFLFLLFPLMIPLIVAVVGTLSDSITGRSRTERSARSGRARA